jgi:hypothetical protein
VVGQLVWSVHCPLARHDCTVFPAQRLGAPGVHTPPHFWATGSQTKVQAAAGPQWPVGSQVSTMVVDPAAQRVTPGWHSPVHSPLPLQT